MIALLLLVIAANVGQALSLFGPAESRPHVAIRSPRSAARSRGTRNAYRGPRPAVMTRYPQVAPRVVRID